MSTTGWTKNGSYEWDYGVVELNCSIGRTVGTFGYNASGYTGTSVSLTGFPGEKKPAGSMWTENGKIDDRTDRQLYFTIDETSGQSGAPVYKGTSKGPVIVGVTNGGLTSPIWDDTNYARRVDSDLIAFIKKNAQ